MCENVLSILGLVVGMIGVIITVIIFCVQCAQNRKERKIQELLKVKEEISVCSRWCDEFIEYNWLSNMKFSETIFELNYHIRTLEEKIRSLKNFKCIYVDRYDETLGKLIWSNVRTIEVELRMLHEGASFQNAYIEHYFSMGNPHDETGWDHYQSLCNTIHVTMGVFKYIKDKLDKDYNLIQKQLEALNYRNNIIDMGIDEINERELEAVFDERKKECYPCADDV